MSFVVSLFILTGLTPRLINNSLEVSKWRYSVIPFLLGDILPYRKGSFHMLLSGPCKWPNYCFHLCFCCEVTLVLIGLSHSCFFPVCPIIFSLRFCRIWEFLVKHRLFCNRNASVVWKGQQIYNDNTLVIYVSWAEL